MFTTRFPDKDSLILPFRTEEKLIGSFTSVAAKLTGTQIWILEISFWVNLNPFFLDVFWGNKNYVLGKEENILLL